MLRRSISRLVANDYQTRLNRAIEDAKLHDALFPAFQRDAQQVRIKEAKRMSLETPLTVNGRIGSIRSSGANLAFIDVHQDHEKLQLLCDRSQMTDSSLIDQLHRGDCIQASGQLCRTPAGELSVRVREAKLLAACLQNIPDPHAAKGLEVEYRMRNRHIGCLSQPETANLFRARSKLISSIRRFLEERDFLEVETPILATEAGGASAEPFATRLDTLDLPLVLRIAPELYLKRLIVGGFDRVFELGKVFRNEGIDASHNPEFTICEIYQAYASMPDMMRVTEEIISEIIPNLSFQKIDIVPALEAELGVKLVDDAPFLTNLCTVRGIRFSEPDNVAHLYDKLIGAILEPLSLAKPTFLVGHPICMSPLARSMPDNPHVSDRFELFIKGMEVANGYSEINSPILQRQRFQEQQGIVDEEYCRVLEAGMPPTAGLGLGIDRLVMLATGQSHIREVLAFPFMKPLKRI